MTKTLVRCPLSAFSNTPRNRPSWPAMAMEEDDAAADEDDDGDDVAQ